MVKNKIERYSWIKEMHEGVEVMNQEWWNVQAISDNWSRILVVYTKKEDTITPWWVVLDTNNTQDAEQNQETFISTDNWWTAI